MMKEVSPRLWSAVRPQSAPLPLELGTGVEVSGRTLSEALKFYQRQRPL